MCCAKGMAKCFLIVFNAIFFLLGGALLGLGVWVMVDDSTMQDVLARIPDNDYFTADTIDSVVAGTSYLEGAAIGLIVAGSFIFIIGFCGCCGAIRENKCLLGFYAFFVILIVMVEIAAVVLGFLFYDKFETEATDYLEATIYYKYQGSSIGANGNIVVNNDLFTSAWDLAQMYFQCCGVWNSTDYANTTSWNNTFTSGGSTYNMVVPPTCCKVSNPSKFPSDVDNLQFTNIQDCLITGSTASTNTVGCFTELKDWVQQYSYVLGGVGAGIAALEFLGIVSACVLMCKAGKDD